MATITMKQLLEAGIHFGHQTRRWNPKMSRYIFGERHGIYIIDLKRTLRQLQKAYVAVRDTVANGGTLLFVGTKKQARDVIEREATRCGMFYVNNRWLGGALTNWETIQKSVATLKNLEEIDSSGKIEAFTKKEGTRMRKHRDKLDKNLCGIKNMERPPSIMFVVDSNREAIAVREAERIGIPCVAIVDTNSDPDAVPIPIPGNDDAIRAINLFCSIMADAALDGRMTYEKKKADDAEKEQKAGGASPEKSAKLERQKSKFGDPDGPPETIAQAEAAKKQAEEAKSGEEAADSDEPEAAVVAADADAGDGGPSDSRDDGPA